MHKQLYQLVEEYQRDGDARKLAEAGYEMFRYLSGYGPTAMALENARVVLLPPAGQEQGKPFANALANAVESLEAMGMHPTDRANEFALFASGFADSGPVILYSWAGRTLYSAVGAFDGERVHRLGERHPCKPQAVPFLALAYAVLVQVMLEVGRTGVKIKLEG